MRIWRKLNKKREFLYSGKQDPQKEVRLILSCPLAAKYDMNNFSIILHNHYWIIRESNPFSYKSNRKIATWDIRPVLNRVEDPDLNDMFKIWQMLNGDGQERVKKLNCIYDQWNLNCSKKNTLNPYRSPGDCVCTQPVEKML